LGDENAPLDGAVTLQRFGEARQYFGNVLGRFRAIGWSKGITLDSS